MSDTVNKPAHYNQGSIECIEAMKIVLTPEEFRGYLKGNVFKYLWREKDKNGNEDIRKGKSYYDWLIELIDESEQQKAVDLQSLKDHPFGKLKKPKLTPKVGDWVRIKKPYDTQSSACIWVGSMNKYDGQVIHVKEIEEGAVVHEDYGFLFSWLEPAEQPVAKESLTAKPDPGEGYRLLSKDPPEKLLDTDEGLFACGLDGQQWLSVNYSSGEHLPSVYYRRKIEPAKAPDLLDGLVKAWKPEGGKCKQVYPEQSQPPDGWRWLEVGEVIRKGDKYRDLKSQTWIEVVGAVGDSLQDFHKPTIRRNRFEVGEKVVRVVNGVVYKVIRILSMGYQLESEFCAEVILHGKDLAPYIEDAK